jgi:hypothetical protein
MGPAPQIGTAGSRVMRIAPCSPVPAARSGKRAPGTPGPDLLAMRARHSRSATRRLRSPANPASVVDGAFRPASAIRGLAFGLFHESVNPFAKQTLTARCRPRAFDERLAGCEGTEWTLT